MILENARGASYVWTPLHADVSPDSKPSKNQFDIGDFQTPRTFRFSVGFRF